MSKWWLVIGLISAQVVWAIEPVGNLSAAQEARYRRIIGDLRCLVCQNQSLSDSNAALAKDMRAVVHRMVQQQVADETIITFMTDRYGDFVLYRPPVNKKTWLLWVGPFLTLFAGAIVVSRLLRKSG